MFLGVGRLYPGIQLVVAIDQRQVSYLEGVDLPWELRGYSSLVWHTVRQLITLVRLDTQSRNRNSPCNTHRNLPIAVYQLLHPMHSRDLGKSINTLLSIYQLTSSTLAIP